MIDQIKIIQTDSTIINNLYKDKQIPIETEGVDGRATRHLSQREYLILQAGTQSSIVKVVGDQFVLVDGQFTASGIKPKNKEQIMALDALLDPEVHTVVLTGPAGTGKTILALAAATQLIEDNKYEKLILTKPMTVVGKQKMGALPGSAEEKLDPYLINYMSNIEFILKGKYKNIPAFLELHRVILQPLQLILGASFWNSILLADEIQTLTLEEMYALGTRPAGESKLVLMGDFRQRHEPIAKEKTGLHKFINSQVAKDSPNVAVVNLVQVERGPIATLFANVFE